MALVSPDYVQGKYSVAQRDVIFDKAAQYPDPSGALPNQVPMVFPDGTVNWRQLSAGSIDGTANANIAVVEETQYASYDYAPGDLLIFNGQLYEVRAPIASGEAFDPQTNIGVTTVALSMMKPWNKGENLLRNWFFIGGGSQQGGGQLPINQKGSTSYTNAGQTIDGWYQTGGTTEINANHITHTSPAGSSSDFYQIVDRPVNSSKYDEELTFGIISFAGNYYSNCANIYNTTGEVTIFTRSDFTLLLEAISDNKVKAIIRVSPGSTVRLYAAKLEIGSRGTLAYHRATQQGTLMIYDAPPDYGEELRKCQRYFNVLNIAPYQMLGSGVAISATEARISISLPAEMATTAPTVTLTGILDLYNGSAAIPVTAVSTYTLCGNNLVLAVSVAGGLSTGASYMFLGDPNSSISTLTIKA